jgi:hypothetical protein
VGNRACIGPKTLFSYVLRTRLSMPAASSAAGTASSRRACSSTLDPLRGQPPRSEARSCAPSADPGWHVLRSTPEEQAGARRHDARRRDAPPKSQPLVFHRRIRGAGSEQNCAVPSRNNQPPRLFVRRLSVVPYSLRSLFVRESRMLLVSTDVATPGWEVD